MMKFCLLLLTAAACAAAQGQQGQQQCPGNVINQFLQCESAAHQQLETSAQQQEQQWKAKFEQFKQQADQCYTNAGCQVPQMPRFGKGGPKSKGPSAEKNPQDEASRNATRQCRKAIHDVIEQRVQTCAQNNYGLTLPNRPEGGPKGHGRRGPGRGGPKRGGPGGRSSEEEGGESARFGGHGPHGGPKGGQQEEARFKEYLAKTACNSTADPNAAAGNALSCIAQLKNSSQQQQQQQQQQPGQSGGFQPPAFFQQFCAARNACSDALTSAGCSKRSVHSQVEEAERNCSRQVREQIKANNENVSASIAQCQVPGVRLSEGEGKGHGKGGESKSKSKSKEGGPKGGHGKEGPKDEGKKRGQPEHGRREEEEFDPCDVFSGAHDRRPERGGPHGGPEGGPHGRPEGGPHSGPMGKGNQGGRWFHK